MRILQIYNQTRSLAGGEENVVHTLMELLKKKRIQVKLLLRSSRGLDKSLATKARAFWSGIYSRSAHKEMVKLLETEHPNVVHVHNLYPLFSPSVLIACRQAGIPAVMSIHNYALTCPNWYHLYNESVCDNCVGGHEYWCVMKNCREDLFESIGYALRTAVARKFRLFHDNVTFFIALTDFAKNRLIDAGFAEKRIVVLPNMVSIPDSPIDSSDGEYVAYAGRISPEKGIDTLLAATRQTGIPVCLAGDGPLRHELVKKSPKNAAFVGLLDRGLLAGFYRKARFVVVPSKWFEMCPLVISEAMSHGLPVIASKIGGLPELVGDGVTGLLFEPGNARDLADKMKHLWENQDLCRQMGMAGRKKAIREYSEDVYYEHLMAVYTKAIKMNMELKR